VDPLRALADRSRRDELDLPPHLERLLKRVAQARHERASISDLLAQLHQIDQRVLMILPANHGLKTPHFFGELLEYLLELASSNDHPFHLHRIAHSPENSGELRRSSAARTGLICAEGADVAGDKPNQRVAFVESCSHQQPRLSRLGGPLRLEVDNFNDRL